MAKKKKKVKKTVKKKKKVLRKKVKKVKKIKKKAKPKKKKKIKKSKPSRKKSKSISLKLKKTPPVMQEQLPWRQPLAGEVFIGIVEDYFSHVGVLATTLKNSLDLSSRIHVRGHTTDIVHAVNSMQIEHNSVSSAVSGDSIGIKICQKVRKGDYIYKIL